MPGVNVSEQRRIKNRIDTTMDVDKRQAQHGQHGSGGTGQDDGVQMVLQAFCLSGFKIRYR